MKRLSLILVVAALSGCRLISQQQMDTAQDKYVTCLHAHPKHVSSCEAERLEYETYKEKWKNTMGGLFGTSMGGNRPDYSHITNCTTMDMGTGMATTTCQ